MKRQIKCAAISLGVAFVIIFADIVIKLTIMSKYPGTIENCNITGALIHFHPRYNTAGSTVNMLFGLTYNRTIFIFICIGGIALSVFTFVYLYKKFAKYGMPFWGCIAHICLLAGTAGRFIERLIMEYTLDYIAIKHMGVS